MKSSNVHIPRVLEVNVRVKRMSGVRGGGEQKRAKFDFELDEVNSANLLFELSYFFLF